MPDYQDKPQAIRQHYEPLLARHRHSFRSLDWASRRSQMARFRVLADNVPLSDRTLLDVGCGLGDLLGYLERRKIPARYAGVDILERMLEQARAAYPQGRFLHADIFEDPCPLVEAFDVVFCSGMLNLNLGNNLEFLPRAIERFFSLSGGLVVVNLLHVRCASETHRYFFYDPDHVLGIFQRHADEVRLLEDYLPNDFTLIARRGG